MAAEPQLMALPRYKKAMPQQKRWPPAVGCKRLLTRCFSQHS